MSSLTELKKNIAASLYMTPCTMDELCERDFLKTTSRYGIDRMVHILDNEGAVFYKGKGNSETVHIRKKWAKKNLQEYELDFRTEKQKKIDSMSRFSRQLYKQGLIDLY